MNNWGIPDWLEKEVKKRDKTCIYCGIQMIEQMPPGGSRKAVATWKHIQNNRTRVRSLLFLTILSNLQDNP